MTDLQRHPPAAPEPADGLPMSAQALLDAIMTISSDLDLRSVLTRLVTAAAELTQARYGALGVIGRDGELTEFITTGIDELERERIGAAPRGHGILGLLIKDPRPLRLADLGRHPDAVGMPPSHPPMHTFLGAPIRIRGTVFGNLYLTEKANGEVFTEQDQGLVQALANAAGLVVENARAYGLSERRRQWLQASAELADTLQPPVRLEDALHQIARRARAAAGAVGAAIIQFPAELHPVISAADGSPGVDITAVVREILPDLRSAGQYAVAVEVDLGERYALVLPLRAHLTDPGALLVILDRTPAAAGYEEREFLAAFADQAGLALDRAEAVADREELAVVSERARIARDLHDVVIQRLFATGLKLQGLRAAGPEELDDRIESTVDDLDLTIKDIRTTIFGLQQTQASVRRDLLGLLEEYAEVLGYTPSLHTDGPVDLLLTGPVAEHLLAVAREALSNVARHAHARDVIVDVAVTTEEVVLRVLDDGTGIAEDRTESGLRNARERADLLGGTLSVGPNAGPGTVLTWTAPLLDPR